MRYYPKPRGKSSYELRKLQSIYEVLHAFVGRTGGLPEIQKEFQPVLKILIEVIESYKNPEDSEHYYKKMIDYILDGSGGLTLCLNSEGLCPLMDSVEIEDIMEEFPPFQYEPSKLLK